MNLFSLPIARLLRTRRAWLSTGAWSTLAIVAAVLARSNAIAHGADRALLGTYGSIALPLLVYGIVAAAVGGEGLARSGNSLVVLGASPFRVARATLFVAVGASIGLGAVLAAVVGVVAHGTADPPLAHDLIASAKVGAVGAAAYAAYFAMGASVGLRGFGRSVLLVLDWVFGMSRGMGAVLTPRAHVRSLLGGVAPLDLSARTSFLALAAILVACSAVAVWRGGRVQWKMP